MVSIIITLKSVVYGFLLCALLFLQAENLKAQNHFGIQFRPGISFATTDLGDANLKTGFGFELSASYRFMPHVSAYAGWGWSKFSSAESFAGSDSDFEETGYMLGLQFIHPFHQEYPFDYFLRAGAILNHIEIEDQEGEIIADSGHGVGFQVETGFAFELSESWRLIPGIKYQSLSREIEMEGINYSVDLNYLSVGVTVSKQF